MKRIIQISALLLLLTACKDDIFERDLKTESVDVIVPSDNYQSTVRQVHFKWDEVEGATHYKLEIVSPSFSNIADYILDSNVVAEEYYYTFLPGHYEWRLRAENNASETIYTPIRSIQIDTTSDLNGQVVDLYTPNDAIFMNLQYPTFTWLNFTAATDYDIEIKIGSDFNTGVLVESANITTASYTPTSPLTENTYTWGIRANNATSSSLFYTRTFDIDLTTPGLPTNLSPDALIYTTNNPISFSWNRATDNGTNPSTLMDSLYIYNDASLTSLFKRVQTTSNAYVDSISTTGTFYWQVKTFDAAGNEGAFTASYDFIVQ